MSLNKLFNPKSIAIIGASNRSGSVGNALIKNLLSSKYKGKVYPVNPIRKKISQKTAYKSILDIKNTVDLAIIAIPAKYVNSVLQQCGQKKTKNVIIISAGFSELGKSGESLSKEIKATADEYNINIIGPNCLGIINPSINLNASFAQKTPAPGNIALISQSGALCTAILDWAASNKLGFSKFISIGEMLNTNFSQTLKYLEKDPQTKSIFIYMETLKNAPNFLKTAKRVSQKKPIIVLKVGRSNEGAKAAKSHTGSLTGNDKIFSAAFKQSGIIRVNTINEFFGAAKILSNTDKTIDDQLTIITNAGGPGVIATDALIKHNGQLNKLSKNLKEKLNKILPETWSHSNPIDIIGDASPDRYQKTIKTCLKDKTTNTILVLLTPQFMTDPDKVAQFIIDVNKKTKKLILTCWLGQEDVEISRIHLKNAGIPSFSDPEEAIKAYIIALRTQHAKTKKHPNTSKIKPIPVKANLCRKIIRTAQDELRTNLSEDESKQILKAYKIPTLKYEIAKTAAEAGNKAEKLGYPLAIKILSPDILHKTEINGVHLNIQSKKEAIQAYNQIIKSTKSKKLQAKIKGVIIEKQFKKRFELILGCKRDPLFGPIIIFGRGGVTVEVLKDITMRIPPLNSKLAKEMIEDTKIHTLLKGYRNMPGVDLKDLQLTLIKLSQLILEFPEIEELDINPFIIDEKGAYTVDAKIVLNLN